MAIKLTSVLQSLEDTKSKVQKTWPGRGAVRLQGSLGLRGRDQLVGYTLCTGVIRQKDVCQLSFREGHQYVPKFCKTSKPKPKPSKFCIRTSTISGLHRISSRPWNYQRPPPQPNRSMESSIPLSTGGMDTLRSRDWTIYLQQSVGFQSYRVFICSNAWSSSILYKHFSRTAVADLSASEPV